MNSTRKYIIPLLVITVCSLFLFMGLTYFHTKGEPREAVVALSMLKDGNWILPVNNGIDMAYKPPFFHWCIAVISSLYGEVTEYTSRMPSAIALALMVWMGFFFYAKRRDARTAFIAALITLTNFEVHRAGVNCRVDMVLTAMMVMALYRLYIWGEKGWRGLPLLGILFLSAAALTKGPVGIVLPCIVPAVFFLIRGVKFWTLVWRFSMVAILACILPACWYVAAYNIGGDKFLQLVLEENVLRFLGKMTYSSHENPAYYNVITVVAGYLPYTLLVLISLFFIKYSKISSKPKEWWQRFVLWIKNMDDTRLYTLLSIVIIFVFYCIPKSKRSVYLLPIYPFIAYYLAEYILWLRSRHVNAVRYFGHVMAFLAVLLTLVFAAVRADMIPDSIFSGRSAAQNIAFLHALENVPVSLWMIIFVALPLLAAAIFYYEQRISRISKGTQGVIYSTIMIIMAIFMSLDAFYQPTVLNVKSDKPYAMEIAKIVPEGRFYSFRSFVVEGNRMHPFSINFYVGDRIAPFDCFMPENGYLVMGEEDYPVFVERYGNEYNIKDVYDTRHRSCDDKLHTHLYYFNRKQQIPD